MTWNANKNRRHVICSLLFPFLPLHKSFRFGKTRNDNESNKICH